MARATKVDAVEMRNRRTRSLCWCYRITLADSTNFPTPYRWTTHGKHIRPRALGAASYFPSGGLTAYATRMEAGLRNSVSTQLSGQMKSATADGFTLDLFRSRRVDTAVIDEWVIDWRSPWVAPLMHNVYGIAQQGIRYDDQRWSLRLQGLSRRLEVPVGAVWSRHCDHELGDGTSGVDGCNRDGRVDLSREQTVNKAAVSWSISRVGTAGAIAGSGCGANIATGDWVKFSDWPNAANNQFFAVTSATTNSLSFFDPDQVVVNESSSAPNVRRVGHVNATVQSVTAQLERQKFTVRADDLYGLDVDWFRRGYLQFMDGIGTTQLAGLKESIDTSTAPVGTFPDIDVTVTLEVPMPFDVTTGLSVRLYPGCMKRKNLDCDAKFGNIINYRAAHEMPGGELALRTGDAT